MSEAVALAHIPYVKSVEGARNVGYVSDPSGNWICASMNGWFIRLYQYADDSNTYLGVFGDDRPWYASYDRNPTDDRYYEHSQVPHPTPWDALEYFAGWAAHIDNLIAAGASAEEIREAQTPAPTDAWIMPESEEAETEASEEEETLEVSA